MESNMPSPLPLLSGSDLDFSRNGILKLVFRSTTLQRQHSFSNSSSGESGSRCECRRLEVKGDRNLEYDLSLTTKTCFSHRFFHHFDSFYFFLDGLLTMKATHRAVSEMEIRDKESIEGLIFQLGRLDNNLKALECLSDAYLSVVSRLASLVSKRGLEQEYSAATKSCTGSSFKGNIPSLNPIDILLRTQQGKYRVAGKSRHHGQRRRRSETSLKGRVPLALPLKDNDEFKAETEHIENILADTLRLKEEEIHWKSLENELRQFRESQHLTRHETWNVASKLPPALDACFDSILVIDEIQQCWEGLQQSVPQTKFVKTTEKLFRKYTAVISGSFAQHRKEARSEFLKAEMDRRRSLVESIGSQWLMESDLQLHYGHKKNKSSR